MRIVIKVGTSTLTHATGNLNIRHVEELCKVISDLKNAGHEVILVSSGAIGMGVGKLGLSERPKDMPTKQAAAAVGQCELMYVYDKQFSEYGHNIGQILAAMLMLGSVYIGAYLPYLLIVALFTGFATGAACAGILRIFCAYNGTNPRI